MTRIFPDHIRFDPICRGFYPSVSDSEYPISVTDLYPNPQKLHFYDVNIYYNFIWQKLTISISDSVFEHKYENKYDINNIRSCPIYLHPYSQQLLRIPGDETTWRAWFDWPVVLYYTVWHSHVKFAKFLNFSIVLLLLLLDN